VASRMLLGMARAGDMPRALARVSARRRSPVYAALVVFVGAAALVPVGRVALAGSVSSLATLLSFGGVAAAVIALRLREPARPRAFRVPWSVRGVPVPSVLAGLSALALATQFPPAAFAITGTALGVGVALALSKPWWRRA